MKNCFEPTTRPKRHKTYKKKENIRNIRGFACLACLEKTFSVVLIKNCGYYIDISKSRSSLGRDSYNTSLLVQAYKS